MFEQSALQHTAADGDSVITRGGARPALPDRPLVVIEPKSALAPLGVREAWAHRELLYLLAWRDLKVRYKQTLLGVVWVVLQPLLLTIIFTVFLSVLVRVPSDGAPYPVFVYTGLLVWTFFSGAVMGGGNSLVSNAPLVTKVYFPRIIVPVASVAARLIDFAIAFCILAALLAFYRVAPTWKLLALPPLVALVALLAVGCASLLSALNVKYRDVGIVLPVLIQLWMYVSPVVYPSRLVYEKLGRWGWVYALNPLAGILDGMRAALFGGTFDRFALCLSAAWALGLFLLSTLVFRRVEGNLADLI